MSTPPRKSDETAADRAKAASCRADHAGDFLLTMLWSADPILAARADDAGIDRIGLDLEILGKADRQRGLGTWVSSHRIDQLRDIRSAVRRAEFFCRINPIHADSQTEIDQVLAYGVEVLMLPMFTTVEEVEKFVAMIDGRAKAVPLLEHRLAVDEIDRIVRVPGLDCIHVGLTDLALSLNAPNRFALMASPLMERVAAAVNRQGLRLCIGGIGRALDDSQPIPTDAIYAQYARLNATGALVSRAFFGVNPAAIDVGAEVDRCRQRMTHWRQQSAAELVAARSRFVALVGACPAR
jgi:2-keto-3-deoxy-L-rhamnonate aldolase RhmA